MGLQINLNLILVISCAWSSYKQGRARGCATGAQEQGLNFSEASFIFYFNIQFLLVNFTMQPINLEGYNANRLVFVPRITHVFDCLRGPLHAIIVIFFKYLCLIVDFIMGV
jgi:hypothetical protein